MRVLVFDPFHGAAGDMIVGALMDCGADRKLVTTAMQAVVAEPVISRVSRSGIQAVKVETTASPAHRTLAEVMKRLDAAAPAVPARALGMARNVFLRINEAEKEVHGSHEHFHEVGADDAIADVIGACTAYCALSVDAVSVLPVNMGSGSGTGSHGRFPIPAPATAAILTRAGLLVRQEGGDDELCTPTGAALLAEFSSASPPDMKTFRIQAVGYGAGSRDPPGVPNVLRAMVVETTASTGFPVRDVVDILETNIDDVSGEVIASAITRLIESGARDASIVPVIMKKGRPGYLIRVICLPETSGDLAALMAQELGTLGIRCIPAVHRFIAGRATELVDVEISGKCRAMPVKIGRMNGNIYMLKAEFEDARTWASELGIPVRKVIYEVEKAGWLSVGRTDPPGDEG